MSESVSIAGPGQRVTLRYVTVPVINVLLGLLFTARFFLDSASAVSRIFFGVMAAAMLTFGLSMLSSREIQQDRLVVRRLTGRKTIMLSQLSSADFSARQHRIRRPDSQRGGRTATVRLRDKQGAMTVLSSSEYAEPQWQAALSALAPYIMAPGVQRTGPVEQELAGRG
ncbi:MAG: hypothetical protein ABJB47_20020 [Actinomycetota bacterium]